MPKTVSLVLGIGGASGIAHLGVIKYLEENKYQIKLVVGCSIGSAVAADLENEKEVWLNKGSLFNTIRASVSLPLFFTPYELNGIKLVDGGVLNPVPIAPTFGDDTDLKVTINSGGSLEHKQKEKPKKEDTNDTSTNFNALFYQLKKAPGFKEIPSWVMYNVSNKAFDTIQSTIAIQKIASYPLDIEIIIARNACGTYDFDRSQEMIDLGYQKTLETFISY